MTTKPILATATALLLLASAAGVQAQQPMGPGSGRMGMDPEMRQRMMEGSQGWMPMGPGMMRGAMSRTMGQGMSGQAMRGTMLRMFFALMDADGDREVSREEFHEAHDRIFNHMDAEDSGAVTLEEMLAFFQGPPPDPADTPND